MATVAVLPSRYQSSRFPGKPLALISGRPMIQWVWEAAKKAKGVDLVVVATDDIRIASVVTSFGGQIVMTDSALPSGTDRVAAAVEYLGNKFDLILNIQGDEPAIHHETITDVVRLMQCNPNFSMGTTACHFTSVEELLDPNSVKVIVDDNRKALYFSRYPIPYIRDNNSTLQCYLKTHTEILKYFRRHIGIYAYRPDVLQRVTKLSPHLLENLEKLEQLRALAAGISIGVAPTEYLSIGVDISDDIKAVELLLSQDR